MGGGRSKGLCYLACQLMGRHVMWGSLRSQVIRPEMSHRNGPLILALSHLSHLDPLLASVIVRHRPIAWMARAEFYRYRIVSELLAALDALCVRRFGVAASAVRGAIERLRVGAMVGICPEGGVTQGALSVLRGGPIKKGVCLIACRSGAPILPCIMLGTDKLNRAAPWIPYKRARLYVAFGRSVIDPPALSGNETRAQRRAAWDAVAAELSRQYQALFREALEAFALEESFVP